MKLSTTELLLLLNVFQVNNEMGIEGNRTESLSLQLEKFNSEYEIMCWLRESADWSFATNISDVTTSAREYAADAFSDWMRKWKLWARSLDLKGVPYAIRQSLETIGSGNVIMTPEDSRTMSQLKSAMGRVLSSTSLFIPELSTTVQAEVEVASLVEKIRNPRILKDIWKAWRLKVGGKTKPMFLKLLNLSNKIARENGFNNIVESWQNELGMKNVKNTALSLWNEVKDLYAQIHAYTRSKLKSVHGSNVLRNIFIPAHLLGSLWGENWSSLFNMLVPYPDHGITNISQVLISQDFDVSDIVKKSEEFYVRAGFSPMKQDFWEKSIFTRPADGTVVDCHAASYDFGLGRDFRLRMCGEIKENSLIQAVHEMGHIQYFMAYHSLPMIYRAGANSAFHEAVGETMVYALQNPKCLNLLGIGAPEAITHEVLINNLMKQALSKIVLLPWVLVVEVWRYDIFENMKTEDLNLSWWKYRKLFQGLEPPDDSSGELFDAGTKYHIINNIPYIRYFIGRFLEHQFLEQLCSSTGENIYNCCVLENPFASVRLEKMMKLGSLLPWQDALEQMTGKRTLSAKPLLDYYRPLYTWLLDYNKRHNLTTIS